MAITLPSGFKYTAAFLAGRPQHHRFDDFSRQHPKMDRRKRAKIFAPFDALDGYSDSIDSKNVEYVERIELEEAERIELNRRLQILRALTYNSKLARANRVQVSVRYYTPCTDHNRFAWQMLGQYMTMTGICRKVDPDEAGVIKIDEAAIPLADVAGITASDESIFNSVEGCHVYAPLRPVPGEDPPDLQFPRLFSGRI